MRRPAQASSAGLISRRGGLVALFVVVLAALTAGSASAADFTYTTTFSGPGTEDGQLETPGRAAVEQATGNLFVVDSGNNRVQVFKPSGEGAEYLTQFGNGQLAAPWGIAIDEAAGQTYVYVADAGNERIVKYDSDGAEPPSFSVDGSFTSPPVGAGAGKVGDFHAALAVDPTTHELLVADPSDNRVERFSSTGTPTGAFDGSAGAGSPGAFTGLLDVAVNSSGDVYVIDANGPDIGRQEGTSQALRYSSAGSYEATLTPVGPSQRPATVTVDRADDSVVVSGTQDAVYANSVPTLHAFNSANVPTAPIAVDGSATYDSVAGLAAYAGAFPRIYAVLDRGNWYGSPYGSPLIQVFKQLFVPQLTIDPASSIGINEATLSGTVNPNGLATTYHFEYQPQGSPVWESTSEVEVGSGSSPVDVETQLEELEASTAYKARLTATNSDGTVTSPVVSFATPVGAPTVRVIPGSGRTTSAVRLNGTINPNGLATTYRFEWGATTAYGNTVPAAGESYAGLGQTMSRYSKPISGLAPNTTIHYRIVAKNESGVTVSADQTVVTLAEEVGYEMASPPNKQGSNLLFCCRAHAAPSGEKVQYVSTGVFSGGVSSLIYNPYLSSRETDNWGTKFLPLPQTTKNGGYTNGSTQGFAPDLSKVFQFSRQALLPGAVADNSNMYLHDLNTGELHLVASFEDQSFGTSISDSGIFMGATEDGSHMFFRSPVPLLPGAGESSIYDYTDGGLRLASVLPDGTAASYADDLGFGGKDRLKYNSISADGSRFFFTANNSIYMREGDTTIRISGSQRSGHDPAKEPILIGSYASADGSTVYFVAFGGEENEPLTDDAPAFFGNGQGQLYKYDVASGKLSYVAPNGTGGPADTNFVRRILAVSDDGSVVYFNGGYADGSSSSNVLTPDRLYVAVNGTARLVGLDAPDKAVEGGQASPDGRVFGFASTDRTISTPPANTCANCEEVYAYSLDRPGAGVSCVSCNPSGAPVKTLPYGWIEPEEGLGGYIPHNVIDDGSVFFESDSQLVPEDTNDNTDVYRWKAGQLDLISRGYGSENSFYGDATPDGRSVFFYTGERLVTQDVDDAQDLYVARVGGGLPAQNPPLPEPPCAGEGCLNRSPDAPADVTPGSNGFAGPGNQRASFSKARCARKRQGKKAKKARAKTKTRCTVKRHQAKKNRGGHK